MAQNPRIAELAATLRDHEFYTDCTYCADCGFVAVEFQIAEQAADFLSVIATHGQPAVRRRAAAPSTGHDDERPANVWMINAYGWEPDPGSGDVVVSVCVSLPRADVRGVLAALKVAYPSKAECLPPIKLIGDDPM